MPQRKEKNVSDRVRYILSLTDDGLAGSKDAVEQFRKRLEEENKGVKVLDAYLRRGGIRMLVELPRENYEVFARDLSRRYGGSISRETSDIKLPSLHPMLEFLTEKQEGDNP